MDTGNNKDKQEVPDALGNDKLQGEDMAKAGHGERVYPKKAKEEEQHETEQDDQHEIEQDDQQPGANDDETIGIP